MGSINAHLSRQIELHVRELPAKDASTTSFAGYPFRNEPIQIGDNDSARFKAILSDYANFEEADDKDFPRPHPLFGHPEPEFAITWMDGESGFRVLVWLEGGEILAEHYAKITHRGQSWCNFASHILQTDREPSEKSMKIVRYRMNEQTRGKLRELLLGYALRAPAR